MLNNYYTAAVFILYFTKVTSLPSPFYDSIVVGPINIRKDPYDCTQYYQNTLSYSAYWDEFINDCQVVPCPRGTSFRQESMICDGPSPSCEPDCFGDTRNPYLNWSQWGQWSSEQIGIFHKWTRYRTLQNCDNNFWQSDSRIECQPFRPNINHAHKGVLGEWSNWSPCSATCGQGEQRRRRDCIGSSNCDGELNQVRNCSEKECPGTVGPWSGWEQCSVTCGSGTRRKTRECFGSSYCNEDLEETEVCNESECPGTEGPWSDWEPCSVTCGSGKKRRTRTCNGSSFCIEPLEDFQDCNEKQCIGSYGEWTSWGECSKPCGGGTQTRTRICEGSEKCEGPAEENRSCNEKECEKWTCDIKADSCQFPSEEYHNRCVNDKEICLGNGKDDICKGQTNEPDDHYFCNPKMEGHSEITGSKPWARCDVNTCFYDDGGPKEFGSTDERCKIEVKKCLLPFKHNGKEYHNCTNDLLDANNKNYDKESFMWCATLLNPDGTMKQDRWAVCNEASCRLDKDEPEPQPNKGVFGEWTEWGQCSEPCDGGVQTRTRTCQGPGECEGLSAEEQSCNEGKCECQIKTRACKFPSESGPYYYCVTDQERCGGQGGGGEAGDPCPGQSFDNIESPDYYCQPDWAELEQEEWTKPWGKCNAQCFNVTSKLPLTFESGTDIGGCGIVPTKCKFPFNFDGKTYDKCTNDVIIEDYDDDENSPDYGKDKTEEKFFWCATETTSDGDMLNGKWGECDQSYCKDYLEN